jgi:hypothetical protein
MDQKEFMQKQIDQINLDKWLEGERIGRDPGDEFVRKWVLERAEKYRKENG